MDDLALATSPALTQSGDATWDQLFTIWLRRQALSRAAERLGPIYSASEEVGICECLLEGRFGKGWRGAPEANAEIAPLYDKLLATEEALARDYFDPVTYAAVDLAMHPAPNLAAALFKIEMIQREELRNYEPMPRSPWEIVLEDMARLEGAA